MTTLGIVTPVQFRPNQDSKLDKICKHRDQLTPILTAFVEHKNIDLC